MSLANCSTLTELALSCLAAKDPSGVRGRVWIGFKSELDVTIATDGDITEVATIGATSIYKFESKHRLHAPKVSGVPGEKIQMFDQEIMLHLFAKSKTERKSIRELWKAERMVVFYETEGGQIMAAGVDKHPFNSDLDDERGLKGSAFEQADGGATVNEDKGYKVTLKGVFYNEPLLVTSVTIGQTTLAQIISGLDLLV